MMADLNSAFEELGFDPDALHRKYIEERDKRLRRDGNAQYIDVAGELAHFRDDPFVNAVQDREAIEREVDVVVVGGGFGGLMSAGFLRRKGIEDVLVIERGSDFGGTWYWNRYPGAACDVESHIYLPLLEEIGHVPTKKYVDAEEIWQHTQAMGRAFGLYEHTLFQTDVQTLDWDDSADRWTVRTNRGDAIRARFVVLNTGLLTQPKLPGIPGIDSFKGHMFHTSRWDYAYTGGDARGNLTGLQDKRVGIIGTGATGIQCVPHLGQWAKELFVFQRTPAVVDVRDNRPTDPAWVSTLQPGWQERRMENFDKIIAGVPQDEDLVGDSWTDIWRNLVNLSRAAEAAQAAGGRDPAEMMQLADYKKMEGVRKRVSDVVKDPATAEALKPWYNMFCKRPCFHDEYLPTFNRPNVKLVDTHGKGVERITETGVVVEGVEYPIDCLIFATGFDVPAATFISSRIDIRGVGGERLRERWSDGIKSLHGIFAHGFPNLMLLGGLRHATGTVNIPLSLLHHCRHASAVIARCLDEGIVRMEATLEAEARWDERFRSTSMSRTKFLTECTPGYYNNEGNVEGALFDGLYGGGPFEYFEIIAQWRETDFGRDLELKRLPPATMA